MSITTPPPILKPKMPELTPELKAQGIVINPYTGTFAIETDEPITTEDVRRFLEEDELNDEQ